MLSLVGVAWLALGSTGRTRAGASTPAVSPAAPAQESSTEVDPPDRIPDAGASDSASPARSASDARRAVDAALSGGAGDELAIALVDEAGNPLPGADAWVLLGKHAEGTYFDVGRIDAWAQEHGQHRTADANGAIAVRAELDDGVAVVARSGALWGRARFDGDDEPPHEVELGPDVELRARVIDVAGVPLVGAKVQILQHFEGAWRNEARAAESREPDGLALFPHAQETVDDPDERWTLELEALFTERESYPLDPLRLTGELYTFVVPAHGSVLVTVLDEEGAPFLGAGDAHLGIVGQGEARRLSPFAHNKRLYARRDLVDGRALFPFVELGVELEVEARREDAMVETKTFVPGPTRVGERLPVDVRLGSDHPVVQFRALDASGAPLRGAMLAVAVDVRTQHLANAREAEVASDEEGRARVDLDPGWTEGSKRTLLIELATPEGQSPETGAPSADVDLSRELGPGLHDIGDVGLREPELFVAGRVVDELGRGVADAELRLHYKQEGRDWWESDWDFGHSSGADGRFEVRGFHPGEAFRLSALDEGRACEPVEFRAGDRDVVVAVQAEGAIAGRLLLPSDFPLDVLEIELRRDERGLDAPPDFRETDPEEDGSFRFGGVLPGEYTLVVQAEGASEELVEVTSVRVNRGEETRDPRLAAIDLRELRVHSVTVDCDDGGSPNGTMRYGRCGSELSEERWFWRRDVTLVTRAATIDLEVAVAGYRAAFLEGVRGEIEVRLRRGHPVRLLLTGDAVLPAPPTFVKVALVPENGDGGGIDWSAPPFDERREVLLHVTAHGRMRVQWVLEQSSSGSGIATSVQMEEPQFVEVLDADGEQTIEVSVSREQMEKIVSALD